MTEWWQKVVEFKPIQLTLILSAVGGAVWYFVNRRYARRDYLRSVRFEVYRSFLNKMDEAHNASRINFSEIMKISAETTAAILKDPENSNEAIISMGNQLSRLTNESVKGWAIYSNEINQLTLVCSSQMLPLVEELRDLNKKILDTYSNTLSGINFLDPESQSKINHIASNVDSERMTNLYISIKSHMRKEIGNN